MRIKNKLLKCVYPKCDWDILTKLNYLTSIKNFLNKISYICYDSFYNFKRGFSHMNLIRNNLKSQIEVGNLKN